MKIKNLDVYLKERVRRSYIQNNQLLSSDDELLTKLYGEVGSRNSFVSNVLQTLTSFASDSAYDQIFYEFLQNAKDANGDSFWVYYEEAGGLVFLNNGEPFHTNSPERIDGEDIETSGSLFSFLGKGKGTKDGIKGMSGKYGKGSKLIFNLLAPGQDENGGSKGRGERITSSILEKYKAPILFSWSETHHLDQLIEVDSISDIRGDHQLMDEQAPLLCKLFLSYFPALPGQSFVLPKQNENITPFDQEEFSQFQTFVTRVLDKNRSNQLLMKSGSLMYIPAPSSVIKEMKEQEGSIRKGLQLSLRQLLNGTGFKHIFYNNEKLISPADYQFKFCAKDETENKNYKASVFFDQNPHFIENTPNIFTDFFPVSQEKHSLAYTLQCDNFIVTDDRQRLKNYSGIFPLVQDAFLNYWERWMGQNINEYCSFVNAVLVSENPRENAMKEFHNAVLNKVCCYIPTNNKIFGSKDSIIVLPQGFEDLKPEDFGMDVHAIHPLLFNHREELKSKWEIEIWTLTEFLRKANIDKVKDYFKSLNSFKKKKVWKVLEEEDQPKYLKEIPFIPLEDGQYASPNDFIEDYRFFLCLPDSSFYILRNKLNVAGIATNKGEDICDFVDQINFPNINKFFNEIWNCNQIKKRITSWSERNLDISLELKESLISTCVKFNEKTFSEFFRNDVPLFCDERGNRKCLAELLPNIETNSEFAIPWTIKFKDYGETIKELLSPKENWWSILQKDVDVLRQQIQKYNLSEKLIKELAFLVESYRESKSDTFLTKDFPCVLNDKLEFVTLNSCLVTKNINKLSEDDYQKIGELISKSGYQVLDKKLTAFVAHEKEYWSLVGCHSIKDWDFDPIVDNHDLIKILKDWCDIEKLDFFSAFHLSITDNGIQVTKKENQVQYFSRDKALIAIIDCDSKYQSLPQELFSVFENEINDSINSQLVNSSDPDFLIGVISKFGAHESFIDTVSLSYDGRIKKMYVEKLSKLELFSAGEVYSADSFEVKILRLALKEDDFLNLLIPKIILDEQYLKDIRYQNMVTFDGRKYLMKDLLPKENLDTASISKLRDLLKYVGSSSELDKIFHIEEMNLEQICNKLKVCGVENPKQVCFLMHFADKKELDISALKLYTGIIEQSIVSLLDVCYDYKQKFTKHWDALNPAFMPSFQIIPQKDNLWADDEKVPEQVVEWSKSDLEKEYYLHKMLKLNHLVGEIEEFREVVLLEKRILSTLPSKMSNATFYWMEKGKYNFDCSGVDRLENLIVDNKLNDKYVISIDHVSENKLIYFKLSKLIDSRLLYTITPVCLRKNSKYLEEIKSINLDSIACVKNIEDYPSSRWKLLTISNEFSYNTQIVREEWTQSYYFKWKNLDDNSKKYQIFITSGKIPFNYNLLCDGEEKEELGCFEDEDFAYHLNSETCDLYLSQNLEFVKNALILKGLELLQDDLFPHSKDKGDLVRLLSLANQENEDKLKILEGLNIQSPEDLQRHLSNKDTSVSDSKNSILSGNTSLNGIDNGSKEEGNIFLKDLDKLSNPDLVLKSWPVLMDLIEKYGEEAMERLQDALSKKKKEATPSILSGYIGEQLCKAYLLSRGENSKAEWVGGTEWAYDILWDTDKHVEVKTKLGTLYDEPNAGTGTTAVYLRRSQLEHIEKSDNAYYLLILSLTDLNLKEKYDNWKYSVDLKSKYLTLELKKEIEDYSILFMKNGDNLNRFRKLVKFLKLQDGKLDVGDEKLIQ